MAQRSYYTLVASLPHLQSPRKHKALPMSKIRLEERLDMLDEADKAELETVVRFIKDLKILEDDASYKAKIDEDFARVTHEGLKELMVERVRWRTVLAALRRRTAGEQAAPEGMDWGYDDDLMQHIAANWEHPTFRLSDQYPSLTYLVNKYIDSNEIANLADTLIDIKWDYYKKKEEQFEEFSLETVALFVLRWKLIKYCLDHDGEAAVQRVSQTVNTMIEQTELGI